MEPIGILDFPLQQAVRPVTFDEVIESLNEEPVMTNTPEEAVVPTPVPVQSNIPMPEGTGDFNYQDIGNAQIYQKNGRWYSDNAAVNAIMNIESSGNARAHNASGASGLFQFIPSTWKVYGQGDVYDPYANLAAFKRYTAANIKQMIKAGIPITATNIYLAHQQGIGGLKAILKSIKTGAPLPANILRNVKNNALGGYKGLPQFLNDWDARIKRG